MGAAMAVRRGLEGPQTRLKQRTGNGHFRRVSWDYTMINLAEGALVPGSGQRPDPGLPMTPMYAEPLARHGTGIRTCRGQRGTESVRVVVFSRLKVVRGGFHLVLKDAIGGSARCIADDEHAPIANIDPDGIRLAGGSLGDRPARPVAGASLVFPAHGGHLQQSTDTLPNRAAAAVGVWRQPEPRSGAPA